MCAQILTMQNSSLFHFFNICACIYYYVTRAYYKYTSSMLEDLNGQKKKH